MNSKIDPKRAALVVLDCEEGVASRVLADAAARETFANSMRRAIELASKTGLPVIRVDVAFRPGHVEVAASNAYFSTVKTAGRLVDGTDQTAPMHELQALLADSPRVVKRRIGAITGTDLELLLRGLGRNQLLLTGLITRGAVLSTACHAADLDYEVVVLSDGCADMDSKVHQMLLETVLPLRAVIATIDDIGR